MFTFLNSIFTRLGGAYQSSPKCNVDSRNAALVYIAERGIPIDEETHRIAEAVLKALLTSSDSGPELASQIKSLVPKSDKDLSNGWTESLALAVFSGLENALNERAPMGTTVTNAYHKVASVLTKMAQEFGGFAEEHPVYVSLLALGILVCFAPWAVEALGFGPLGPIEGSFAAWWQARFAGYVPKGSLFSFLQRLGMVWSSHVKV